MYVAPFSHYPSNSTKNLDEIQSQVKNKDESEAMGFELMKIIDERLSYYQCKLEIIEAAMNAEMQKEHRARNYGLLNFLAKERDVFRYVSSEVRLIVDVMDQPSGNN